MRITKLMLEAQLKNCRDLYSILDQENKALKKQLNFIAKLMPNASMIIAMEKMTEALAHTISDLKRRNR